TARPDEFAYRVRVDLDLDDARSVRRNVRARLADGLLHRVQDVQATFLGLLQSVGHDLRVDTADLDVHLKRSDAVARARDLEVHITVVVFRTGDVRQDGVLVSLHHESQ